MHIDPDDVFRDLEKDIASGKLKAAILENSNFAYGSAPTPVSDRGINRFDRDGNSEIGTFTNGHFVPNQQAE